MFSNVKQVLAQHRQSTPNHWPRPTYLGTTFSPLQCYYMNLDFRQVFDRICTLGLNRMRLGAYWNVIQKGPNEYDFAELDWLLDRCDRHNIEVALVVGMKAPRWPEFHFPQWVSDRAVTGAGSEPNPLPGSKLPAADFSVRPLSSRKSIWCDR
jgi:hypothetical protein